MRVQLALTLIVTTLELVFYAGSLYGWASLQPVLIREGYFSSECNTTAATDTNETAGNQLCSSQVEQLNLVFTIVTSLPILLTVASGFMLDRYGNWVTRTLLLAVFAVGLLVIASSRPEHSWTLYVGFSLLSFAGLGLLTNNYIIGNLVPAYRASVVTLFSGAFDSGTLAFFVLSELYRRGYSFQGIFYAYTGGVTLFVAHTFALTPQRTAPHVLPDGYVYGYRELSCFGGGNKTHTLKAATSADEPPHREGGTEDVDSLSLRSCLKELYTWTEILHYCLLHFLLTHFIGTFNIWIRTKVAAHQVDFYTSTFGVMQGLGVLLAPLSGLLMDRYRRSSTAKLGIRLASLKSVAILLLANNCIVITAFALSLVPNAEIQVLTMALQVIARAFVYATAAAFCSCVYPTEHFGFMYGLTESCAAIALLAQYPVTLLVTRITDNSFVLLDLLLLMLCVLSLAHPLYLLRLVKARAVARTSGFAVELEDRLIM